MGEVMMEDAEVAASKENSPGVVFGLWTGKEST